MNDDIGARLRIIHRAGCTAPSDIAAMPVATAMGRNPAIDLVADGKGGELFRCRLCGMREGEAPALTPMSAVPRRGPGRPRRDRESFWREYRTARDAGGKTATDAKIAEALLIGERHLRRLITRFGRPAE